MSSGSLKAVPFLGTPYSIITDDKTLLGGVTRLSRNFSKPNDHNVEYYNLGTWGIFCDDWEDNGRCPISSESSDQNLIIEHYKKRCFKNIKGYISSRSYGDCTFTFFKQKSG